MPKPYNVFIVYARKDADYLEELRGHLRPMEHAGLLNVWCDREIDPGVKWEEAILRNMDTADIFLLLVSSYYYNSSYIHVKELSYALERHKKKEATVIPVIVSPCNFMIDPIVSSLQALPQDAQPVTEWPNRDNAWLDVVRGIRKVVENRENNEQYAAQRAKEAEQAQSLKADADAERLRRERDGADKKRRDEQPPLSPPPETSQSKVWKYVVGSGVVVGILVGIFRIAGISIKDIPGGGSPETFTVTVFVHGKKGKDDRILKNQGQVILGLRTIEMQSSINEKGEATFMEIPMRFKGKKVPIRIEHPQSYRATRPDSLYLLEPDAALYLEVGLEGMNRSSVSTLIGDMMPLKQELLSTDTLFGYTLVDVQGGTFTMGSSKGEKNRNDDECQHEVVVASFQMGKYEVTQKQWKSVMGANPSKFISCEECPVEGVSWNEVQQFISKLNERSPIKYRLPTEVEWEYAARGGVLSRGYLYAGGNILDYVGWFYNNSGDKTHPVGSKLPNELGLHDMSGNVMEWCQDWKKPYPECGGNDFTDSRYVIRGGSWSRLPRHCRVAYRFSGIPDYRYSNLGFRLVRSK